MASSKKKWSDLSSGQKAAIVVAGIVEVVLSGIALKDLRARPADQVRGPKALWFALCGVQPVGPIAYLTIGRR